MGTVALLQVLAQHASAITIPDGGTKADSVLGLCLGLLVTGILLGGCVLAVRKEQWPMVALMGLLILGTQAALLFFVTQLLAVPAV